MKWLEPIGRQIEAGNPTVESKSVAALPAIERWYVRSRGWIFDSAQRKEQMMPTNTVRFHRVLRATPERVYRAFLDADAMAKWLPPNGFTGKVHHLDAKVGGSYSMSFTNFSTGHSHSFGGTYLELKPRSEEHTSELQSQSNLV